MIEITLSKGHKETDPLRFRDGLGQTFDFFMVQEVHILFPDLIEMVFPFNTHGRYFNPVSVFPVTAGSRYFAEVYFRVEISREGIAVVTAVAVENINRIDMIEFMFFGIGTICLGYARVKAAA